MRFLGTLLTCLAANAPFNYGPLGHLKVSKQLWQDVAKPGRIVIDATCGNGHDSLELARLSLTPISGKLYCMDLQEEAITNTRSRLEKHLSADLVSRVDFIQGCHSVFPSSILSETVSLICYNLGYLPGLSTQSSSNSETQQVITTTDTTLKSLSAALPLLKQGGMLTVTAYPGHDGGEVEVKAVQDFLSSLSPDDWRVYSHAPLNRPKSPILYAAFRIDKRWNKD